MEHAKVRMRDRTEGDLNGTAGRAAYESRMLTETARSRLAEDAGVFLHQALSTPCMNVLVGAAGTELIDSQGRRILDFHGNSVHQVGHGHPAVVRAIKDQLDQLPFCPRRYTNSPAIELARRLGDLTGGRLSKVLLAPGGTLAIGMAMKLARLATGRFRFVSMWGAFHGASLDAISIGGEAIFRKGLGPLLPGCEHVVPCAPSKCALKCDRRCSMACAESVEEVLEREGDVAAVIAEPIRCTTVDIPPREYWESVRAACDKAGALLIFDEIPTCLGRTGKMFSYEHFGVTPDIVVIGKGLGGGIFPQAAMLSRAELDIAGDGAIGHYTHEKSPVGAAAALATLDVIRDEGLVARAAELGESWREELRSSLSGIPGVRDIRGVGLLVGIELTSPNPVQLADLTDRILYACLEAGLNFKVSDGRVLTLTPPLTVSSEHLQAATAILTNAIRGAGC